MKLFTKIAISSIALAGILQAEVTLIGVDGGVTVLGARVGVNAGLTVGYPGTNAYSTPVATSTACPTAVTVDPCSYVCGPCVVVEAPCPKPTCVVVCDPCDPCAK